MNLRVPYAIAVFFIACFCNVVPAQSECGGREVLGAASCAGDETSSDEKALIDLINNYRAQSKLPPVALSAPLARVANRHIIDLKENLRTFTHSWSNCAYDIGDQKSWPCMAEAPRRLGSGYAGNGFENLYLNVANGGATPAAVLEAWKKSPPHNALILNLDVWKRLKYDAIGVSIRGNYAALWIGIGGGKGRESNTKPRSMGLSYAELTRGLTSFIKIERESSVGELEKWAGVSPDGDLRMEIYGTESDVSESTIGITAKLDQRSRISDRARSAILIFLSNLSPNWVGREKWLDLSIARTLSNPKVPQRLTLGNKVFEMRLGADRSISISAKPNPKAVAVEL